MENVTMFGITTFGTSSEDVGETPPDITKFPAGFFKTCNPVTDICGKSGNGFAFLGDPGTCIPDSANVLECSKDLSNCVCKINTPDECEYQLSIIDVYIINSTNEQLHLDSGNTNISLKINDLGSEDLEELPSDKFPLGDFVVGWVSSTFQPPNVIDIDETVLIRGAVSCIKRCCKSDVTFRIDLAYHIGIPSLNLGILNASLCRNKLKGRDRDQCRRDHRRIGCKIPFKAVDECTGATVSISPPSPIYTVIPAPQDSQFTIILEGGKGPTECNNRKNCKNNERCINNQCVSATGATGCVDGICDKGHMCQDGICVPDGSGDTGKQVAIIIGVSVTSIVIIFVFLFYLVSLSKSKSSK